VRAELRAQPIAGVDAGFRDALLAADLPIDDLTEGGRRFFRFDKAGTIVGYGGFEPHGDYALIRSIIVLPHARGTGAGRIIAEAMMQEAAKLGAGEAFLLTTTASHFFRQLGFKIMDRDDAPAAILNTRQATTICSSATLLARRIRD
jgi:N-acetylglutamate synthase-like GNAT family acetyltransferase